MHVDQIFRRRLAEIEAELAAALESPTLPGCNLLAELIADLREARAEYASMLS